MNDYEQHLAASIHQRWNTPEHILLDAIAEVTRERVASRTRIVHGAANEVYDIAFDSAPPLIVRITRDPVKDMEQERWAIARCEALGVTAPHIHLIKHLTLDGAPLHLCIMAKIAGTRLSETPLTQAETRGLLHALGDWMFQLNAIPVSGFSYLNGRGETPGAMTYEQGIVEFLKMVPEFEAAADAAGIEAATLHRWCDAIADGLRDARPEPVLTHNDLYAHHVLVKDGKLAGVIDFGEIAGEPALNDFAKWDFLEDERFPVAWLKEGYRDPSLFDAANAPLYGALRQMSGLYLLRWYHQIGFVPGRDRVKARLFALQLSA